MRQTTYHGASAAGNDLASRRTDLVSHVIRASTMAGLMREEHLQFEVGHDGCLHARAVRPSLATTEWVPAWVRGGPTAALIEPAPRAGDVPTPQTV